MNVPLSKLLPWMVGGTAVAALENQLIGSELPDPLKKVNLGIGASTGALMASGPKGMVAGLSGIPIKQSLLFGIGGLDKLRRQQQALTDTNLESAHIQQDTAKIERRNAAGSRTMQAAFLLPALLGSGALAYYALNQRRKDKARSGGGGFKTVAERGSPVRNSRKIRLDIPPSALPNDFFDSLLSGESSPKSRLQVLEKGASFQDNHGGGLSDVIREYLSPVPRETENLGHQVWDSTPGRILRTVGNIGAEMTGIPSAYRAARDLGTGFGEIAGGNMNQGARHVLGGAGNALVALPTMRLSGAGMLAKLTGRQRLLRQLNPAMATRSPMRQFMRKHVTGMPWTAQFALDNVVGNRALTKAEVTALKNPATRHSIYKALYNNPNLGGNKEIIDVIRRAEHPYRWMPFMPKARPKSLLGEAALLGGRTLNVGDNALRAGYNTMRRFPNASMLVAGTPLSMIGTERDEMKDRQWREEHPLPNLPWWQGGQPTDENTFMSLLHAVGNRPQQQVTEQMGAPIRDPYGMNVGR